LGKLQAKVARDEIMQLKYEARRKRSKMPSSLTLEMEERARNRFYKNQVKGNKSLEQREIIKIVNVDGDGLINNSIYPKYAKLL
jgi:hypothetical protein